MSLEGKVYPGYIERSRDGRLVCSKLGSEDTETTMDMLMTAVKVQESTEAELKECDGNENTRERAEVRATTQPLAFMSGKKSSCSSRMASWG